MVDHCVFHEDDYKLSVSRFLERPWTLMEPLYVGAVPSGLGTPDGYCSIERNGEPCFLVHIYGSSISGTQAIFWHTWLVICSEFEIHFISIETRAVVSFDIGYFCSLYPTDEYLFAGASSQLFCFKRDAQQLWKTPYLGMDEVEIISVENERVLGRGFRYDGSDEYHWLPFALSLATGEKISQF